MFGWWRKTAVIDIPRIINFSKTFKMTKYKLGLYAQYSKFDGSLTGTMVKASNDAYKSNKDSANSLLELVTDNPDFIYKTDDFFDIPKRINLNLATCDVCGCTKPESDFITVSTDDSDYATQCWDCV
jgi:hypothetical protein